MGGKPSAGGGMRYQASATPAAGPERKKIAEGKSRSRYAGSTNKTKDEATLAKKKLLGQ